jgi:hypothetical protein
MPCKPGAVLTTTIVASVAYVASPIPRLIRLKVIERLHATRWHWP